SRGTGQIAAGDAPAPAVPGRPVHRAEAFLLLAIGIGRIGISRLLPRPDEGAGERRGIIGRRGDEERTLAAVIVALTLLMAFRPPEIGQDLGIGPAAAAPLGPAVIIAGMA